jgi:membrane fusion protein, multidrug efflux system
MKQCMQPAGRLLVFLFCTLALFSCKDKEIKQGDHPNQAPANVTVSKIQLEKTTSYTEIMSTVQAAEKAVIAARISGHITGLSVVPGSKVSKGDLLVKISAGEISDQLQQAKAQLAQTERNLERERNLLKKNASTPETVRALEDTQRISLASVREVQTMLDYATITAPFTGTITRKSVNIGDLAAPGKPLLEIENALKLQVVADIPESMILKIQVGDNIPVSIPAAGFTSKCKVEEISPAADPQSRTAPIKLSLPADPNLRSGQFGRLSLPAGTTEAIFIPRTAILPFGQMERVFIVQDGKARLRLVRTGTAENNKVEVLSGLAAGDEVVVAENTNLTDGQPVTITQ